MYKAKGLADVTELTSASWPRRSEFLATAPSPPVKKNTSNPSWNFITRGGAIARLTPNGHFRQIEAKAAADRLCRVASIATFIRSNSSPSSEFKEFEYVSFIRVDSTASASLSESTARSSRRIIALNPL